MKKSLLISLLLAVPSVALGVTVEGKSYDDTVTVAGKTLKLVGAGLREKWFFDVYAMAAYSESGACDAASLVTDQGVKYLRLDMLRDVSAEKMGGTIGEAFVSHMPKDASAELKTQRQSFVSYFQDECTKDTVIEFTYDPTTGTHVKQNGKELGKPLAGVAFQKVLWDIYFGSDSCCEDLKEQIIKTCSK